jgi:hypothetical protein
LKQLETKTTETIIVTSSLKEDVSELHKINEANKLSANDKEESENKILKVLSFLF